jgi:hypothetical protein
LRLQTCRPLVAEDERVIRDRLALLERIEVVEELDPQP